MRARRSGVSASTSPRLAALTVLVALAVVGCGGGEEATRDEATTRGVTTARPQPPALCAKLGARIVGSVVTAAATELSGLVLSRSQRGVLWTHNDSGDVPRLLAVGLDGRLLADVALTGAEAFDWEDIAAGPRELYVGDIGDNVPQRDSIVVYRVPEPRVAGGARPTTAPASRIELRYPDGRHNAEALVRDPVSGALVVVTKSAGDRAGIYIAGKPAAAAATTMRRSGSVELPDGEEVTAGDVSADGRTIALRTYTSAYVWHRRPRERVAAALRRKPCTAGAPLFGEGQGEALALAADGRAFYTVPEGPTPAIRRYAPG